MVLCCYVLFVVILPWLFDWFVMAMYGVWILVILLSFADGFARSVGCCCVVRCLVFVLVCVGWLLLSDACLVCDLVVWFGGLYSCCVGLVAFVEWWSCDLLIDVVVYCGLFSW